MSNMISELSIAELDAVSGAGSPNYHANHHAKKNFDVDVAVAVGGDQSNSINFSKTGGGGPLIAGNNTFNINQSNNQTVTATA
jgi:hypothetical protein